MERNWKWIECCCILIMFVCSQTMGQDASVHTDSESFKRSGYDYLWSVVQDEYDEFSSESSVDEQQYFDLTDMTIRTSSHYGDRFKNQHDEMKVIWLKLLRLDDTPPLYVQYRYHSSQPKDSGPDQNYLWHGERLLEVAYQMDETGYPDYIAGVTWLRAAKFLEEAGRADDRTTIALAREHGIGLLVKSASLNGIDPRFHEFLATRIAYHGSKYDTLQDDDQITLNKLLLSDPNADPWIGQFSTGLKERSLAWDSRGSEYARKVSEEQWKGFRRHLVKAHRHLTKAWKLRPMWPEAANELISATMGQQMRKDRDEGFWFGQAINARIDDYASYTDFAYALAPKWGGSIEHMTGLLDFIIAQSEEHENMGRAMVGVMNSIANEIEDPLAILKAEPYLSRASELMLYEIDHGPEYHHNPWRYKNLRALAYGHYMNKNYAKSAELLGKGGAMVKPGWTVWDETHRFEQLVPLLGSPAWSEVAKGLEALDADDVEQANHAFLEAKAMLKDSRSDIDPELDGDPFKMIVRFIEITS
jgi:hypothetical protein